MRRSLCNVEPLHKAVEADMPLIKNVSVCQSFWAATNTPWSLKELRSVCMAAYFFSSMFPLQVENVGKLNNNERHNTMKIPFLLFNISNPTQGCVSMLWHHCWVWLHVQQSTSLTTQWQLKLLFEETTNLFWGTWTGKLLSAKLGVVRGQTGCRLTK